VARTHDVLTYESSSRSDPATAWALLARSARWPEWAPHLRGAWGLGDPEVREGARGAARLLGVVPVPATITAKDPGRSWTWRVGLGLVEMVHRVEPRPGGGALVEVGTAPGAVAATSGSSCSG
jgi:hypothetical protein